MKKLQITILGLGILLLTSCASTNGNLQRATATNAGENMLSSDYTVSDVKRKATSVSWKAKSKDGKCYNCEADDMVKRVNCVKVKCSN